MALKKHLIDDLQRHRAVMAQLVAKVGLLEDENKVLRALAEAVRTWYDSSHSDITDAFDAWEELKGGADGE